MALRDEIREQRQSLKGKGRKAYLYWFLEYNLAPTIGIAAAVICVVCFLYAVLTGEEAAFGVMFINAVAEDGQSAALAADFAAYSGGLLDEDDLYLDLDEIYAADEDDMSATYYTAQSIVASVAAGEIDVLLADPEIFTLFAEESYFLELPLDDLQEILQNAALSEDTILYTLDRYDNYMFSNTSAGEPEDAAVLPTYSPSDWSTWTYSGKRCYLIQENFTYGRWKLMVMIPVGSYLQQFRWFLYWFLGIIGCILLCVAAASALLSRYYTGRISRLNLKMDEVKEGNLITHAAYPEEQGSRDELDLLNGSFDLMIEEVRELMKEQYKLGRSVSQAEMKALQAQINPHFLYNTLDLINWGAMDYGADEVAELARNLGQLYRLSLNHGKSAISIEDELRHVQAYYNIENVHYEGAIALDVDVPDTIRPFACLNIILQPFVKNAIVHGIGEHVEITSCRIAIRAWMENGNIIFSVADDGPGIDPKTAAVIEEAVPGKGSVGYGISNVNFRIKLTYGEEYGVRYVSPDDFPEISPSRTSPQRASADAAASEVRDDNLHGTKALIRIRALRLDELEALSP